MFVYTCHNMPCIINGMTRNEKLNELDPKQIELRQARENAGLTRTQLGDLMSTGMRTLARWEIEPGKLSEHNYRRAMSVLEQYTAEGSASLDAQAPEAAPEDEVDLSSVSSVRLAAELLARLEIAEKESLTIQARVLAALHGDSK